MNHLSDIGIEKYGLTAFQRRIGRIHTISGHDFILLYMSIQNRLKSAEPLTNHPLYIFARDIKQFSKYIERSKFNVRQ